MRMALFCLLILLSCSASAVLSPRDDEILVVAVKFIVENEEATAFATLPLLNQSSFPRSKAVISQLNAAAARGACGLDAERSTSLLNKLIKRNQQSISLPVIDSEGRYALIGADISDQAGALLLLQNRGDKWLVVAECLEWANY